MKTQELNEQSVAGRYRLKKAAVAAVSLSLFAVAAAVAYGLCTLQLKNVTQDILNNQREMQQSWVDKSLESIRAWHADLSRHLKHWVGTGKVTARLYALAEENALKILLTTFPDYCDWLRGTIGNKPLGVSDRAR